MGSNQSTADYGSPCEVFFVVGLAAWLFMLCVLSATHHVRCVNERINAADISSVTFTGFFTGWIQYM
ncbi:hypothetical protein ACROYT_G001955 [Oculina patagonica]